MRSSTKDLKMGYADLTQAQQERLSIWNKALDTLMPWFAKEVPQIGNQTPAGLADDIGRVNQLKKDVEKIEKTLKERFKVLREGKSEVRGDVYELKVSTQERTALDQEYAKATLTALDDIDVNALMQHVRDGLIEIPSACRYPAGSGNNLQRHMKTSEVETIRVNEI
jgi:hypothetical protein